MSGEFDGYFGGISAKFMIVFSGNELGAIVILNPVKCQNLIDSSPRELIHTILDYIGGKIPILTS